MYNNPYKEYTENHSAYDFGYSARMMNTPIENYYSSTDPEQVIYDQGFEDASNTLDEEDMLDVSNMKMLVALKKPELLDRDLFPEDVTKIVEVCVRHNYFVQFGCAYQIWRDFCDSWDAHFLGVDGYDDKFILERVLEFSNEQ